MKVLTLIEKLQDMDKDADVFLSPPYDIYDYTVDTVVSKIEESKGGDVVRVYIGTDPMDLDFEVE